MRRLAERVAREKEQLGGSRTLEAVERDSNLKRVLMEQAVEAAKELGVGNVWEAFSQHHDEASKDLNNDSNIFSIKINLVLFTDWSNYSGLPSHMAIDPATFMPEDIADINKEFSNIFVPGIVRLDSDSAKTLGLSPNITGNYVMNLSVILRDGGELRDFEESNNDFAIVVLGSKDSRFQTDAWANPFDEVDFNNKDKVRAPAAFVGKGYKNYNNTIHLNPFIFNPILYPPITRSGRDGVLVKAVNKFQSMMLDGVKIVDASDASIFAHELSHFMYNTSIFSFVTRGHGKGGINEFERAKIKLSDRNRQDFIEKYIKDGYANL